MPLTIVLKDRNDADVTFTEARHDGNSIEFISRGSNLQDTKRLVLTLRPNGATNRVLGKLSIPTVGTIPATGMAGVLFTEVGSFDLSSVKVASQEAADDFIAMFGSLASSGTVESLFTHGAWQ